MINNNKKKNDNDNNNNNSNNNNNNNNNNNGKFIYVFECTIVNLATYRQFTIGCLRLNHSKIKKKKIKIASSLGCPNSYCCNKRCDMLL